jgi:hypothetical protein
MSRSVSLTFRGAMYAQNATEIPVVLLTLSHPDFPDTLRLSSDPTTRLTTTPLTYGTTSQGHDYLFCPMAISLPDDMDERAPTARVVIENVGREIIDLVRSVTTPGTCTLQMVLASNPNTIEIEFPTLDIRGVQYNANVITVEMGIDALDQEPFPAGLFTPSAFPGLF